MKVKIVDLKIITDKRGWLAELLKNRDLENKKFGQLLITVAKPGATKGGHYHLRKEEWFIVISGRGELKFIDNKTGEEIKMILDEKDLKAVQIPLNTKHWIKNLGEKDLSLLAYCSEEFNSNDTDTFIK